jgi:uncharacterized protein
MKIGILSDTHLRVPDATLEYILSELFAGTDLILHAGDIVTRLVLERLEESNVTAVSGNMDDHEVAGMLPQRRVVLAGTKRIGLIHGWGSSDGLADRVYSRFLEDSVDLIVFGHAHEPHWERIDGVYLFNPGSAAHNRNGQGPTVGIVEIIGDTIESTIVPVRR